MALRWFRFAKKQEEQEALEAATPEVAAPSEALQEPEATEQETTEPAADESPAGPRKRRRRGSRGGRGRKKPSTAASSDADDGAEEPAAPTPSSARTKQGKGDGAGKPDGKPERRQPRGGGRRRTPTKRAPLPAAKRDLMISVDVGEQRVAVLEDDRVAEVYLERPEKRSIAGKIGRAHV